ncbi:MAG: DNA-processing protein DprA [Planctomycetaceae bacterium]|nr:DNA-processing protein DprA [Planctomycetaceae bacterium]
MNTHPDEQLLLSELALSLVPGIGPRLRTLLIDEFGSARDVFLQPPDRLSRISGIGRTVVDNLRDPAVHRRALEVLRECSESHTQLITQTSTGYPVRLKEICDAPGLLYLRGALLPADDLAVAIVGSRRCTIYGRRHAERLGASLARAGFTVISGLARGIDAAAHRGAMNAGGRTLAVLASGVRDIYPPEHQELADEVIQQGALISEQPPDQSPRPGLFPQRNRIVSGLCPGVIVVEASRRSGALYTARHAMEQGREVFALPGPVDNLASEGCHELIRDGVTLIRNVDDVLKGLGPLPTPASPAVNVMVHSPREMVLNPLEKEVLNLISSSPVHVDQIVQQTQLDISRVLATLTVLEMRRLIRRLPGNQLVRHDL